MKIEPLSRILSGFISFFTHNSNSDKIEAAFENTVSRDGSAPNAMGALLDMGSHRLINLGAPQAATDAVRLQDVTGSPTIEISGSWDDLTDKPTTFAPSAHTHPESEITGLVADLASKASLSHNHTTGEVTGLDGAIDARVGTHTIKAGAGITKSYNAGTGELTLNASGVASTAWTDLTGVPSTFTPAAHTHPESDVTNLVSDLSNKAALSHSHAQSDITGLTSALSGKAASSHSHASSDITSFTADVRSQFSAGSGISIASGVITATGGGGGGLAAANNLSDVASAPTSRTNLGLGTVATLSDLSTRLAAGTGISLGTASGVTTITATGGSGGLPHGYSGAWEAGITPSTGASTNTSLLNSLISTLNSAGGGTIVFASPGAYQINGTINLKSYVDLVMVPGAYLTWTGSGGTTILETTVSDTHRGMRGSVIGVDYGSSHTGVVLRMHSALQNKIKLLGKGTSTSNTFVYIKPDWTGTPATIGANNHAFGRYEFHNDGSCGTGLHITGILSGYGGGPNGVTLNTFHDTCFYGECYSRCIRIDEWADSNTFSGNTYGYLVGSNGIGLSINEIGSGTASVYNTTFHHLAIDTFVNGSTGRVGLKFGGVTKQIVVENYFNNPLAEGGMMDVNAAYSFFIRTHSSVDGNLMETHIKNMTEVVH